MQKQTQESSYFVVSQTFKIFPKCKTILILLILENAGIFSFFYKNAIVILICSGFICYCSFSIIQKISVFYIFHTTKTLCNRPPPQFLSVKEFRELKQILNFILGEKTLLKKHKAHAQFISLSFLLLL